MKILGIYRGVPLQPTHLTVGQALLELLFTAPRISTYKIEFNDFS